MYKFRKIISFLLVIATLFSFVACEEYNFAIGSGTGKGDKNNENEGKAPTMNDDPTDDFTVTLKLEGEIFVPRMDIEVYWDDGASRYAALVDEEGVARVDGLDGDYRVTLSELPNEYVYNPNIHVATNDNKNIIIDIYPLNMLAGGGT